MWISSIEGLSAPGTVIGRGMSRRRARVSYLGLRERLIRSLRRWLPVFGVMGTLEEVEDVARGVWVSFYRQLKYG